MKLKARMTVRNFKTGVRVDFPRPMKHKARIAAGLVVCSVRRLLLMRGEHRVEHLEKGVRFIYSLTKKSPLTERAFVCVVVP